MSHEPWDDLLSDYLDGALSPQRHEEVEEHLRGCAACRLVLEDYRSIRGWARSYRPPPAPSDPWPGMQRTITWRRRRRLIGGASLGLAASVALLLVIGRVLGGGGAESTPPMQGTGSPRAVSAESTAPLDDESYGARVRELETLYEGAVEHLDPRTAEVVRQSLREIDEALERASAALAADPANRLLRALLERSRAQKLDLLGDVTSSL